MAITKIDLITTPDVNKISDVFTTTAGTVADGFKIELGGKDYKTTILADNTAATAATLTIKAGDSKRAAAEDLVLTVPASGLSVFTLDSAYYGNYTGGLKGYVKAIPSATTVKVAVFETK